MSTLASAAMLVLYVGLGIWLLRRNGEPEEDEEQEFFDSIMLQKEVEALHKKMQKLREYDEMIIDLRLCRPSAVQRAFRMEWMSAAGINHDLTIMADGENPSTHYMLEMAIEEREELNREIQARIFDLYQRACMEDFSEFSSAEKYHMP